MKISTKRIKEKLLAEKICISVDFQTGHWFEWNCFGEKFYLWGFQTSAVPLPSVRSRLRNPFVFCRYLANFYCLQDCFAVLAQDLERWACHRKMPKLRLVTHAWKRSLQTMHKVCVHFHNLRALIIIHLIVFACSNLSTINKLIIPSHLFVRLRVLV